MHEGDKSLDGLDETGISEKSVVCDVRGTSETGRRWGRTCVCEVIKQ
jgi:hypothetical protein